MLKHQDVQGCKARRAQSMQHPGQKALRHKDRPFSHPASGNPPPRWRGSHAHGAAGGAGAAQRGQPVCRQSLDRQRGNNLL